MNNRIKNIYVFHTVEESPETFFVYFKFDNIWSLKTGVIVSFKNGQKGS